MNTRQILVVGGIVAIHLLFSSAFLISSFNTKALLFFALLLIPLLELRLMHWGLIIVFGLTVLTSSLLNRTFSFFLLNFPLHWPEGWALGVTGYSNYPKRSELIFFALISAFWALVGLIYGFQKRHTERLDGHPTPFKRNDQGILLFIFVVLVFTVPNMLERAGNFLLFQHPNLWDYNLILTWQYAHHIGLKLFVDYWYPYGVVSQKLAAPEISGILLHWIHNGLCLSFMVWAVYRLLRNRWIPTVLVSLALFYLLIIGVWIRPDRYMLAFSLCVIFIHLIHNREFKWLSVIGTGVSLGYACAYEPNLVLFSLASTLGPWALISLRNRKWIRDQFLIILIVSVLALISYAIFLALILSPNQWSGYLSYYSSLGEMAAFTAVPMDLSQWLEFDTYPDKYLIYSMLFGFFLSMYWIGIGDRRRSHMLLGLTCLTYLTLQKVILRPSPIEELFILCLFMVLFVISETWDSLMERTKQVFLMSFASISLIGMFQTGLHLHMSRFVVSWISTPAAAKSLFDTLSNDPQAMSRHYFSTDAFKNFPLEHFESARWLKSKVDANSVYMIGDSPHLSVIMGISPAYHNTYWEMAPKSEQKKEIHFLEEKRPKYLILQETPEVINRSVYSGVPQPTRLPMFFDYVSSNYKQIDSLNGFQIYIRREISSD